MFGGGLIGFLFSRNPASLTTGGLFGGAILAMGVISLKVWRQGLSSLPFILVQGGMRLLPFFNKHKNGQYECNFSCYEAKDFMFSF